MRQRPAIAPAGGTEWVVDARGCDPARLADPAAMRSLFDALLDRLELHPVADAQWHCFPRVPGSATGGGITGMCLLAESHLAVHTFPEHGTLCLNVFCCRARDDWDAAAVLAAFDGGRDFVVEMRRIERAVSVA